MFPGRSGDWKVETVEQQWQHRLVDESRARGAGGVHIAYHDLTNIRLRHAYRDAVDSNCDGEP